MSALVARKLLWGQRKSRPKCVIVSGREILGLFSSPMAFYITCSKHGSGAGVHYGTGRISSILVLLTSFLSIL